MALRNRKLQMGEKPITGLADGVEPLDAVNKGQLDGVAEDAADALDAHETEFHANIADQRILSNISGASAQPVPNTLSAIVDDIVGTTQGAILYRSDTAWTKLDPGTAGQLLQTNGATANPSWADPPIVGWETVVKSADTDIISNTTLASDADLQFSMAANTKYLIRANIIAATTSPSGGIKIGITGPASPDRVIADVYTSITVSSVSYPIKTSYAFVYGTLASVNITNLDYIWNFSIVVENGANAGDFAFQFAQATSEATPTTFVRGSYLEYMEV